MDQDREHSIIRQVLAGDREAFALLVEAYQQQLFHMAYVLTGSADQAEDVVQDTFVCMYDKLGSFRLEPGVRLAPWMFAICRHAAFRLRKRGGRMVTGAQHLVDDANQGRGIEIVGALDPEAGRTVDCEDQVFRSEQGRMLAQYLLRLPVELREALVLRFTEELSFRELAEVLGISQQAAKMRVYRGLTRLREIMPGHLRDGA
ncbi:MAG: sigma-70 family RNA polymerase sigma factor [Desulfovibrio sp.]|nr:sigma-70 family RNA polymerase sigma factor [Desulfovibrio sp.]MCA1986529.1 sigma-70 family RNA polymerase sigma factor [Desulfovibrio sp.]